MSAVVVVFHADVAVVGGGGGGGCGGGVSTVYFLKTKFKYWPLSFPFNFPPKNSLIFTVQRPFCFGEDLFKCPSPSLECSISGTFFF